MLHALRICFLTHLVPVAQRKVASIVRARIKRETYRTILHPRPSFPKHIQLDERLLLLSYKCTSANANKK